jgi:hypothetical protein
VVCVVRADRAGLSQAGQWPPAGGQERMLRIYFLQQWFNLSDPAVEEALYEALPDSSPARWSASRVLQIG